MEQNGVHEIDRMEEHPFFDVVPMKYQEEENPEDTFLVRDYAACKGDKIWTGIIVNILAVVSFQLGNRFKTALECAPCLMKCIVFTNPPAQPIPFTSVRTILR